MVFKSYFYQVQLVGYMYVHLQYELVLVLVVGDGRIDLRFWHDWDQKHEL